MAGWPVIEVENSVRELTERGLEFEPYGLLQNKTDARGSVDVAGRKSSWFRDSEGNFLALGEAA